ncbi:MAG: DUF4368 domain-containing protein [Streptococcaceae bacterium]|nr:DUF4368 domain-containing protein [Streptococcaceae bacterium]
MKGIKSTLKPGMVHALIKKIEIGEKEKSGGKMEQKINIIYHFVGNLELHNHL